VPYDDAFRARLRSVLGGIGPVDDVAAELTAHHAALVKTLLNGAGAGSIDVIGFHGHTILHEPEARRTWQIGDGARLAREIGVTVIDDFRSNDMAEGGEGAPLAPLYHAALAAEMDKPLAVLNLGGVGNVTWLGPDEEGREWPADILAFDTGPGNALIDDWMYAHTGAAMDEGGTTAAVGTVDAAALSALLDNPYFDRVPPKSLDRDAIDLGPVEGLSTEDGAATLTAFTAASVARSLAFFPAAPTRWLVTGGGRHNPHLMAVLADYLDAEVAPVEAVGWAGDMIEAQAFGFLAVRSLFGLPLSVPGTTGTRKSVPGGVRHDA
jgi:anhydro-N-acetylmuramic acid kinase